LKLSEAGKVTVNAAATIADGKLVPTPGSGNISLDAHFQIAGHLKVTALKYDGDVPGLTNVDIAVKGSQSFDPFALGGNAPSLTAAIPAAPLPDVPLGTVPGKLQLAIGDGSTLNVAFQGNCLGVHSGSASYKGVVTTTGTLVLKVTLVIDAPLNKSIPLPDVSVPIPATHAAMDLGTQPAPGTSDSQEGSCGPVATADGGSDAAAQDAAVNDANDEGDAALLDPESVLVDSSLVAYYKFDEGSGNVAVDSTGNHMGALTGKIQWFGGKVKLAMYFDGATTSADMGQFPTMASWSLMFWIYSDSVQDNRVVLDANADTFALGPRFNELSVGGVGLDFGNSSYYVGALAMHQWHQVTVTSDMSPATLKVYYDGALQTTFPTNASTPSFKHFLVGNGNENGMSGTHYQGLVDDLRVYNRALSAADVALVYTVQK